ncbi:MAG TPA: hypothetical protein VFV34_05135 [Blastocatellia bacterium]|nr:hypothetical protein [Blastocatellia bacterium]
MREFWYQPDRKSGGLTYRPAVLVECTLNFRSLRAGLNHSEEHNYTAWLPDGDLAIDWDVPAVVFDDGARLGVRPDPQIEPATGGHSITEEDLRRYEADLLDNLVRKERLRLFFSPPFGLFSAPGDPPEHFLARVAEAALGRVLPELKRLHSRFDLQLEQIREAQVRKGNTGERLSPERLMSRNLHVFESESRLAKMFMNLAGSVFGPADSHREPEKVSRDEEELREDLERIEENASEALRTLYGEYVALAGEHDVFEIGLQPQNIQVRRRALLWVPV